MTRTGPNAATPPSEDEGVATLPPQEDDPKDRDVIVSRDPDTRAVRVGPGRTLVVQWTPDMPPITEPCIVDGMPDEVYHRDPVKVGSISHSGIKTLLDVPARFEWERDNGRPPKDAYDYGHAAHKVVLGVGADIAVLPDGDGRSKPVRDAKAAARAAGKVPIKPDDWRKVQDMADVLRAHHTASKLFRPGRGVAERSIFWFDEEFGVWRRGRFDWSFYLPDGRLVIVDYKSAGGKVSRWALGKRVHDFGYHTQDAWYSDGAQAVGMCEYRPVFLFAFQESDGANLVTVVELDAQSREQGIRDVREGLRRYRQCLDDGEFPDYAPGIVTVSIPGYGFKEYA